MQTLKTIVVVAVLLGIGFGVYKVLNPPVVKEPPELANQDPDLWSQPPEIDFGGMPAPPSGDAMAAEPAVLSTPTMSVPVAPASDPQPLSPSSDSGSSPSSGTSDSASVYGSPLGGSPAASPYTAQPESTPTAPASYGSAYESTSPASAYMGARESSPATGNASPLVADAFHAAWQASQQQINNGDLALALFTLSQIYHNPELTPEQNAQLLEMLDQLAGAVIYSREHLLLTAYKVQSGDTLESIAREYQVPQEFLARVNGIQPPYTLMPGEELKVVRGPFRAEIDTAGQEMTLFLGRYYAGRFPVTIGSDAAGQEGTFAVTEKSQSRTYYGGGQVIAPGDPGNPYGHYWIGLGSNLGLHGAPAGGSGDSRGAIKLDPQDAADVFVILADGSQVTIR